MSYPCRRAGGLTRLPIACFANWVTREAHCLADLGRVWPCANILPSHPKRDALEGLSREDAMRLRWVWTVPFITLTAATRAQNLPMPGTPSDNLAAARVFDY